MLEKFRARRNEEDGFTLVELLVVMLILGILAAIAVPAFFSQRDKARDADAKSAVRTAETAIESYATDNGGEYSGATAAILEKIEPTLNDATLTDPPVVTADTYTVETKSDTGNYFRISRDASGVTTLTCGNTSGGAGTVAGAGEAGCPTGGDWSGDAG